MTAELDDVTARRLEADTGLALAFLAVRRHAWEAQPWRERAACREMDVSAFYPAQDEARTGSGQWAGPRQRDDDPRPVCAGCPVRMQCLDFAIDNRERYGIWGGLNERERRNVAEKRKRARRRGAA